VTGEIEGTVYADTCAAGVRVRIGRAGDGVLAVEVERDEPVEVRLVLDGARLREPGAA
jgi:hypothetical protein